jgi:hypothetical protein
MRILTLLVLLGAAPGAASAVPPDRALVLEAAVLTPVSGEGPPLPALSVGAAFWLEGPLEATASLTWADARRTTGRAAALAAAAGLRASAGERLRVSAWAEAGAEPGARGRVGGSVGAGVGVAVRRGPFTLGGRAGLRLGPDGGRGELRLGVEAGF